MWKVWKMHEAYAPYRFQRFMEISKIQHIFKNPQRPSKMWKVWKVWKMHEAYAPYRFQRFMEISKIQHIPRNPKKSQNFQSLAMLSFLNDFTVFAIGWTLKRSRWQFQVDVPHHTSTYLLLLWCWYFRRRLPPQLVPSVLVVFSGGAHATGPFASVK